MRTLCLEERWLADACPKRDASMQRMPLALTVAACGVWGGSTGRVSGAEIGVPAAPDRQSQSS
jgi:hypothetical protein